MIGPILRGLLALVLASTPVFAQDRPRWSAELWATEGGEELVAAVTARVAAGDELVPTLAIMCGFWLRYDPGPIAGDVDWTGQSATFEFDFGDRSLERELNYEAMDGMFAASLRTDDPLIDALQAGTSVTVLMPNGGIDEQTFSLAGSAAAIDELGRSCR